VFAVELPPAKMLPISSKLHFSCRAFAHREGPYSLFYIPIIFNGKGDIRYKRRQIDEIDEDDFVSSKRLPGISVFVHLYFVRSGELQPVEFSYVFWS